MCAIEDSDQPAHPRSLIRVYDWRSMGSIESCVSSGGLHRLSPDCAAAQTGLNLSCTHMPTYTTLCWLSDQFNNDYCIYMYASTSKDSDEQVHLRSLTIAFTARTKY